ncbi:hypothetical protein TL16_g03141 [Triparma laevis f. inornata]|uniref:EF-hand domain-containing protein n=2 Tax=Triparma laevis TaxID=1534972 RepID=A0A9W7BYS7_9STRA|nr:hypothetical protein TL16_g03141 [Triparma laevis f. inornata]GMI00032.1 hypothetical protein TrLO_g11746 [Triparma laevis f. longispina]
MSAAAVSDEEINTIVTFMDPNGDGVSQDEFEEAFVTGRRLFAVAKAEEEGKKLFAMFLEALENKSPKQWFAESNTEADDDDEDESPGLDTGEFLDALKKLGFRKKQTKYLKDYLDPDNDGDIDLDEFNAKLATMNEPASMDAFESSVGKAIDKLEKHMEKNNLKVGDLFRKVDKDGGGEIDSAEMKAFFLGLAQPSKAALAREKKAKERKNSSNPKPVPEEDPDTSTAPSADQLADLMAFLDPDENGISKEELTAGFRDGRRARSNAVVEAKGKRIMKAIVNKIGADTDLRDWFDKVNTLRMLPGSEPVIDDRELKKGIKKLKIKMSAKNLYELLRFVDPDADGDISWGEFKMAVEKLDKPSEMDEFAASAGGTIMQLEAHMKKNKIRMLDLFRQIDKDGSGEIDNKELKAGIEKVCMSVGPIENPKRKKAPADEPPSSPRAKIEEAKVLDANINLGVPPPVAAE